MKYLQKLNRWIPIPEFEGFYVIHSDGRVRSIDRLVNGYNGKKLKKGKLCSPFLRNGYYAVALSKGGFVKQFSIHRLLAITFIENPNDKATVNHKNGIKTDNKLKNLEWATPSEQQYHAIKSGLYKPIPPTKIGDKLSMETKLKMSKSRMGRVVSEETRDKIRKSLSVKIKCIESGRIYDSILSASSAIGVPKSTFHRKMKTGETIKGSKFIKWHNQQKR